MHTKTPWSITNNGAILNGNEIIIGEINLPRCYEEVPEHIVNCVNSHDVLVSSIKELVALLKATEMNTPEDIKAFKAAEEVLKAAGVTYE